MNKNKAIRQSKTTLKKVYCSKVVPYSDGIGDQISIRKGKINLSAHEYLQ